jgi:hypothetical protein
MDWKRNWPSMSNIKIEEKSSPRPSTEINKALFKSFFKDGNAKGKGKR